MYWEICIDAVLAWLLFDGNVLELKEFMCSNGKMTYS